MDPIATIASRKYRQRASDELAFAVFMFSPNFRRGW
jgi:hypothetical protein